MNQKAIQDNLGRAKNFYQKGNSVQALYALTKALNEIVRAAPGSVVPISIRSVLRETVQLLSKDKNIISRTPNPKAIVYTPGKEGALLSVLMKIYNQIIEESKESREVAKQRKLRLDKAYTIGIKLLKVDKVSEADQAFQEAVKSYKDETKIFSMISTALLDAKEPVRASTYLKKAIELEPQNEDVKELYAKMKAMRETR